MIKRRRSGSPGESSPWEWEEADERDSRRQRTQLVLITALIVAGSILGAWYYVVGTPKYSLYRLAAAVDARDTEEVERYLDIDRVADNVTDVLLEAMKRLRRQTREADPRQRFGDEMAQGLVELMKPTIKARFRDEFREQVRKEVEEGRRETRRVLALPGGVAGILKRVRVEQAGKAARLVIQDEEGKEQIQLRMVQRSDRRWRIVGMDSEWVQEQFRRAGFAE